MSNKEIAAEIYTAHLAMASQDGRGFRKKVMTEIQQRTGCSVAASATYYNNCKKAQPVEGLGRAAPAAGVRRMAGRTGPAVDVVPDEQCFSVIELLDQQGVATVGRCQSFLMQGDASEKFDDKVLAWPNSSWVLIQGLGPNHGDNFKLSQGEKEIRRYQPVAVAA